MISPHKKVSEHYTVDKLGERILSALEASGVNLETLTVDDLAPVDEFHIRGRMATQELAQWAQIQSGHSVLDVGCGLGGTSRYLAANFGCKVTGVDLTEEYCRVAEMLSSRVGLGERTAFRQGSALELPFEDAHFDIVWTEHVQMNIENKEGFYGELCRMLKPGGQLVFHDIFAGEQDGLHFPVPWASDESINHLISVGDLEALMVECGIERIRWEDKTVESIIFFRTVMGRVQSGGWMPVGLHLLMGEGAAVKFSNVLRNLEENRLRVAQAVMKRSR